eukprot:6212097-Pleurochrysis_carterae.AAC.1
MHVALGSMATWPNFGAVRAAVARPPPSSGARAMRDAYKSAWELLALAPHSMHAQQQSDWLCFSTSWCAFSS